MWKLIGKCFDLHKNEKLHDKSKYERLFNGGKVEPGISFNDAYNLETAEKVSRKFFNHKLCTNCTPHSIVGCLGFTSCLYKFINKYGQNYNIASLWDLLVCNDVKMQNNLINFIYKKFSSKQISMHRFIKNYLPICDGKYVQIALYVQGLRYHTSKTRRDGLPQLINPKPIISKISSGFKQNCFEMFVKKRNKELRMILEREMQNLIDKSD